MPVKFTAKQAEELFAKAPKVSKRTDAIFEADINSLKIGEGLFISAKEWTKASGGKDLKTLPIHYRGKFNVKYNNDFLEVKKVGASEKTNNEEGFFLKRVDPATKKKRGSKKK